MNNTEATDEVLGDSQPDQDMTDPFFEEFLDLNDLIPGVDEDALRLLPEIPPELMFPPREETPAVPIEEMMEDLDNILAEIEVTSNSNTEATDEVFGDSQPDQDMTDPFFEEFLDLNDLFPDVIPWVDEDVCCLLQDIPPELLILPREENSAVPIEEVMEDIPAETDITSLNNTATADDILGDYHPDQDKILILPREETSAVPIEDVIEDLNSILAETNVTSTSNTEADDDVLGGYHPDQDMADLFFEEFPDLIPGVDEDACRLLPEIPPELLILPKEETPAVPIQEAMEDLDNIHAETDVTSTSNTEAADEVFLSMEVVDEGPASMILDTTEGHSVSSPGSVVSGDSCETSNYTSTYAESTASDNIDVPDKKPEVTSTSNPQNILPGASTVDVREIFPETSVVKTSKRKNTLTEQPPAKKSRSNTVHTSTDKTTQRRIKNNAASRVCRATRKQKEQELFDKEKELTESNAALRAQEEQLTREIETLSTILVQR